jgi:hypothetical protein
MRLQEWQTDAERVLNEVIDGRVDLRWLNREIRRLEKGRNQLSEADRQTADFTLDELQDYLDADEADELSPVDPEGPVSQALRIRAQAQSVAGPDRIPWLQRALSRLSELADECEEPEDVKAIADVAADFSAELGRQSPPPVR